MEPKPNHITHTTSPASPGLFQGASPKLTFFFGLAIGIAAMAIIALIIILPRTGSTKTAKITTPTTANTNTAEPTYGDVKAVSSDDYIRGEKNAKLTLITYTDFECPYCKTFHPSMKQVMEDYKGQVRWVYRNFPLSFHANAQKEGEASLCVGDLGGADKFWSFADKIFERTSSNGTGFVLDQLPALAKEVGVSETKFKDCLDSGKMASVVSAETADGSSGGASGTPTTFLVNKDGKTLTAIPGALPLDQIKTAIDAALAKL